MSESGSDNNEEEDELGDIFPFLPPANNVRKRKRYQRREESHSLGPEVDDLDEYLAQDEEKEARYQKRIKGGRRGRDKPEPEKRIPAHFKEAGWNYEAERDAFIREHNGVTPFCFACSYKSDSVDPVTSKFVSMFQTRFEDEYNMTEHKLLCNSLAAVYEEQFMPLVFKQEQKQRVALRDRMKLQKENMGMEWKEEDEEKYRIVNQDLDKFLWHDFEIMHHYNTMASDAFVLVRAKWYIALALKEEEEGRLRDTDVFGNNPGISAKESAIHAANFRVYITASKALNDLRKH